MSRVCDRGSVGGCNRTGCLWGPAPAAPPRQGQLWLVIRGGAVESAGAAAALETFDEVFAMTWRLLNPKTP